MVYIAKQQLLTRIKRYKALNKMRLQHALSLMGHEARFCLSVVPVLLHYNHINLVGYRPHAPQGIDLFSTNQEQRMYLSRAISSSDSALLEPENRAILAIYAMGSTSSLGQGAGSDLDLWVCTKVGLSADDLSILQEKCRLISSYFKSRGVELNLFVTPQDRFTNFQPDSLDEENCGSAQNFFLLDEFYRSSVRICGRYILWYLISSEEESTDYQAYTQFLLKGITNIPHNLLDPSAVAVSDDDPDSLGSDHATSQFHAGAESGLEGSKHGAGSGASLSGNSYCSAATDLGSLARAQFQNAQYQQCPLMRALIHPGQVHVSELPDQSADILSLYHPVDWHSWSQQHSQQDVQPSSEASASKAAAAAAPSSGSDSGSDSTSEQSAAVPHGTNGAGSGTGVVSGTSAAGGNGAASGTKGGVAGKSELGGLDQEAFTQSRVELTDYYSESENSSVQHLDTDLEFEPTTEFGLISSRGHKHEDSKHHHSHLFHLHSSHGSHHKHGAADHNSSSINTSNDSIEVNYENEASADDAAKAAQHNSDSAAQATAQVLGLNAATLHFKHPYHADFSANDFAQGHALNPAGAKDSNALRQAFSELSSAPQPHDALASPADPYNSWFQQYEAAWGKSHYGEIAVEDVGPENDDEVIARHQRIEQAAMQSALQQDPSGASVALSAVQDPTSSLGKYGIADDWNLAEMGSAAQTQAEVSAQPRSGVELLSGVVSQHSLELGTTWLDAAEQAQAKVDADAVTNAAASHDHAAAGSPNSARTEQLNFSGAHGSSTTFDQGAAATSEIPAKTAKALANELAEKSVVLMESDAYADATTAFTADDAAAAVFVSKTTLTPELLHAFYSDPLVPYVAQTGAGLQNGSHLAAAQGPAGAATNATTATTTNGTGTAPAGGAAQPEIDIADLNSADALNLPQLNWDYDQASPASGVHGFTVPWFLSVHQIRRRLAKNGFIKRWKLLNRMLGLDAEGTSNVDQPLISHDYQIGYGQFELQFRLDLAQLTAPSQDRVAIDLFSAYPEIIYTIQDGTPAHAVHIKVQITRAKDGDQSYTSHALHASHASLAAQAPHVLQMLQRRRAGRSHLSYELQPCDGPHHVHSEQAGAIEIVDKTHVVSGMSLTICSSETRCEPVFESAESPVVTEPATQAAENTSISNSAAEEGAEGGSTLHGYESGHGAGVYADNSTGADHGESTSVDADPSAAESSGQKDFGHGLKAAFEGSFAPIPLWQLGGMHCVSTADMVLDPELSSPQIAPQLTSVLQCWGGSFTSYQQAMDGALLNEEYLKPSLISGLVDPQMVTQGSIAQRSSAVMLGANDPTLELVGFMALRPTESPLQNASNYGLEALVEVSGAPSETYAVSSWHLHHTTVQLADNLSQDALNLSLAVTNLSNSTAGALPLALPSNLSVASVAALAADPNLLGLGLNPYAGAGLGALGGLGSQGGTDGINGTNGSVGPADGHADGYTMGPAGVGPASLNESGIGANGLGASEQGGSHAVLDAAHASLTALSQMPPIPSLAALPTQVAWQAQLVLQSQMGALNQLSQLNAQMGGHISMWGQMGHAYLGGSWSTQVNAGAWRDLSLLNMDDGSFGDFYKGDPYQKDPLFHLAPVQQALSSALLGEAWSNALNLELGALGSGLSDAHLSLAQRWAEGIGLHHTALSVTVPYNTKPLHELCLNGEVLTESDANLSMRNTLLEHSSGTSIPSFGSNVVKVIGKLFALTSDHQEHGAGAAVAIMTPGVGAAKIQTASYSDVLKGKDLSPHAGKQGEEYDSIGQANFAGAAGVLSEDGSELIVGADVGDMDALGHGGLRAGNAANYFAGAGERSRSMGHSMGHFPFSNGSGENSPSLGLRIVEAVGATPMPFMGGMGLFGPFSAFMQPNENDFVEQSVASTMAVGPAEPEEFEDSEDLGPDVRITQVEDHLVFSEPEFMGLKSTLPVGAIQDDSVRGSAYGMCGVNYEMVNTGSGQRLDAASPLLASELRSTTLHTRPTHARRRMHPLFMHNLARSGSAYVGTSEINTESPVLHDYEPRARYRDPARRMRRQPVDRGRGARFRGGSYFEEPNAGHNAWVEPSAPGIMVTNNQEQGDNEAFAGSGFGFDSYAKYSAQYQSTETAFATYGEHGAEPNSAAAVQGQAVSRAMAAKHTDAPAPHAGHTAQANAAYSSSSVTHAAYDTHYPRGVSQMAGVASVDNANEPDDIPLIGADGFDLSKVHPNFKIHLHGKKDAGGAGRGAESTYGAKLSSYPEHGSLVSAGRSGKAKRKARLKQTVTIRDDHGNTVEVRPFKPSIKRRLLSLRRLNEDRATLRMLRGNECIEAARLDQWQEFEAPLNEQEWFDFGSISKCSPTEYFGSGLWLLYKAIDSPFKVVLKILLMEAYASEYTHNRLLASELKDYMLSHEGYSLDMDAYYLMYLRVSQYLQRMDDPRLNLMQKCFYLKIFMGINKKRPFSNTEYRLKRSLLSRLSKRWGWSDDFVRQLERVDYWKMAQVREFYQEVYRALFASYQALLRFSVRHGIEYAITSDDAGILSRKLYAAFDLYPGKILVMHKSISSSLEERNLTFIKPTKKSLCRRGWHLFTTYSEDLALLNTRAVYIGARLCEVVTWATLNGLLSHRTTNYVVGAPSVVSPLNIKQLSNDVNRVLKPLLFRVSESSLQRTREMRGCIVILNLEQDPTVTLGNRHLDLELGSSLCLGRQRLCLVGSVDLVLINSWGEVRSISLPQGEAGVVELLATLLRIIGNSMDMFNEESTGQGQDQSQGNLSGLSGSTGAESADQAGHDGAGQGQPYHGGAHDFHDGAMYSAPHYSSKARVGAYGQSEMSMGGAASRNNPSAMGVYPDMAGPAQASSSQGQGPSQGQAQVQGQNQGQSSSQSQGAPAAQNLQGSTSQGLAQSPEQSPVLSQEQSPELKLDMGNTGNGMQGVEMSANLSLEPDLVLVDQVELLTGQVAHDILQEQSAAAAAAATAAAPDGSGAVGQGAAQGLNQSPDAEQCSVAGSGVSFNVEGGINSGADIGTPINVGIGIGSAAAFNGATAAKTEAAADTAKTQGKRDGKQTSRIKSARSNDEPREHVDVNSILNSIEVCCYSSAYRDLIKYDMELTLRQVVSCLSSSDSSEFMFDVGRNTYRARSDGRRGVMINCKRVFAAEEFDMRVLSRYGMRPEYSMQVPAVVDRYATVGIVQYFFSPVSERARTWDIYIINERNQVSIYKRFEGSRASLVNAINRFYTSQTQAGGQRLSHFNLPQYFVLSKDQLSLHPFTIRGVD